MSSRKGPLHNDDFFYKDAEAFFTANVGVGLTYDDVSLATLYSEVLPRMTKLDTTISDRLPLSLPIISADMDTVTESTMAVAMALNGGLGLIHYNMSEADQVTEVRKVKNHIHGMIDAPATVSPEMTVGDVLERIEEENLGFSTFPVVGADGKLLGLLRGGVVKERHRALKVADAMTPRQGVLTIAEKSLGKNPVAAADKAFAENIGISKLLVVDAKDRLRGLFTLSDIERLADESKSGVRSARDEQFRLRCGAAVAVPRLADGEIDRERLVNHVSALVAEGLDAVAVSSAHGFSKGMGDAVKLLRKQFKELTIIAGNVTSGAGVEYLADCGADTIKIGQGPGSICTTRIVAGVGIPQLTALHVASIAARKRGVRILADGGITKSGDIVKALTIADAVMLGGLLAGCKEAPGNILEINGKLYKEYRGMGSLAAMKRGSASRYGHDTKAAGTKLSKVAAEGVEALKEVSGEANQVLANLAGGVQSGLGYLGASTLAELRTKARYIRVSPAGQKESAPHDVIEIKASKKD